MDEDSRSSHPGLLLFVDRQMGTKASKSLHALVCHAQVTVHRIVVPLISNAMSETEAISTTLQLCGRNLAVNLVRRETHNLWHVRYLEKKLR